MVDKESKTHTFGAATVLKDPVAVHLLQQQVALEVKTDQITDLYIANRGLHELCEEMDRNLEAELAVKQDIKLQLTEARRQLKDVESAVAACGSVYDSESLLQYFCMAEAKVRELDSLKRYGGAGQKKHGSQTAEKMKIDSKYKAEEDAILQQRLKYRAAKQAKMDEAEALMMLTDVDLIMKLKVRCVRSQCISIILKPDCCFFR